MGPMHVKLIVCNKNPHACAMTQRRMFGHREYMVGGTHMSQNGIIIFQRGMQETCNIHMLHMYIYFEANNQTRNIWNNDV